MLLSTVSIIANAATITSTTSGGTWESTTTWVGGILPATTDIVVINTTGANSVTIGANETCAGLIVNSGSILNVGAFTLTVNTNASSVTGTINFTGIATMTFNTDVTVNSGAVWNESAAATFAFAGNFTNNATTFTASTGVHTFSGTGKTLSGSTISSIASVAITGTITNNGTLTVGTALSGAGTFTNSASGTFNVSGNCSVTTFANAGITNRSGTGTTTTILANFTNTGTLNISGSGAITGITNNAAGVINFSGSSAVTSLNNATSTSTLNISNTTVPTISTLTATASGNTVNYNAAGAQPACKVTTYSNLTLSGSGIKTFATTPTVNGILSLEGTATVVATSGVVTYGTNATLQYNTATARTVTAEEWITPFNATGGIIIANTGTITLNVGKVLNSSVPLTINIGASLATNNLSISFGGNFVNGGTFTAGSAPIAILGTGATQNIAGFTTTGLVSMTKTSGTATFTGNVNGAGFTINGNGGTINLGTGLTHTFTGVWTRTIGTVNGGSSTLRLGSSVTNTAGTFTAGTGTVEYYFAGTQTVAPLTYNNLILSGTSSKTFPAGTTTVNGVLSMEGTATTTVTGTLTYGGSATLQYKGGSAQTTGGEFPATWSGSGGIKVENASGVTLGAAKNIGANSLTIGGTVNNSIFNDGGYQLTATGTLNLSSGTFKLGAGSATVFPSFATNNISSGTFVEYAATATQTVKGISYSNLTISGTGTNTKTADADITVNGVLNLSSANASATQGCLDMSSYTLNMGAAATITGSGDLTGIVKRTQTFSNNTAYSFGSQYTKITFLGINGSQKPTWISCKIAIGSAPAWKTNAIQRYYTFAKSDISGTPDQITVSLRYLDAELNSNTEANTVQWDNSGGSPEEHGKSNNDVANNWVELSGNSITHLAPSTVLDDKQWSLGNYSATKNTWLGTSTDWASIANWTSGHVPYTTEAVLIPASKSNYPVLAANVEIKTLEMEAGASLTAATYTLTINGSGDAWNNSGTFIPGSGTVIFSNGTVTNIVSVSGTTSFYNIHVNANTYMQFANASYLRIGGTADAGTGAVIDLQSTVNTVEYNGSGQSIVNPVGPSSTIGYSNLVINGSGTTTFPATLNVIHDFTLNSGIVSAGSGMAVTGNVILASGTTFTANSCAISVSGNWTNNGGSFTPGTGSLIFDNTGAVQTISGTAASQTFNNMIVDKTAQSLSVGGSTSTVTCKNLTVTSGTFNTGTATTINITGNWSNSGTWVPGSGTVFFNGGSAQTISGANTFNNLTINNTGGVSANADQTVTGVLYLQSANASTSRGALDLGSNTLFMGAAATTTGTGDVSGIVTRSSFAANTPYTFGNRFTTLNMGAGGILPGMVSFKIVLSNSWNASGIINRYYDIIQTGGNSSTLATLNLHYLTGELNDAAEGDLVLFDHDIDPVGTEEQGSSNYDIANKWVGLSNLSLTYIATVNHFGDAGSKYWTIGTSVAGDDKIWTGATNTDWNNAGNWSGGIPDAGSHVHIPDAATTLHDPSLPASTTIGIITIDAGGILNGGTGTTLTVSGSVGAWENLAGVTGFNAGTSTVLFTNSSATMADPTNFHNVTVADGASLTLGYNNVMRISGALSLSTTGILNAANNLNTVEYNGADQTIIFPNGSTSGYHTLILSGTGTKTMPALLLTIYGDFSVDGSASVSASEDITIAGNMTIGSGTTLNSSSYTINVSGSWTNSGTFSSGTGTIAFSGVVMQILTGVTTFNNVTINGTGGVKAVNDITVNGVLNLAVVNPSATRGLLEMTHNYGNYPGTTITDYLDSYLLYMGANATTIGSGDVTGTVKRTTIVANTSYSFGHQFTTMSLTPGTMPSALAVTITIGTTVPGPVSGTDNIRDAVKRTYEIVSTGGSNSFVTANFHYLNSELTSSNAPYHVNSELKLTTTDYDIDAGGHGAPESDEHGRANYDHTNKYIGLSSIPISYFIQVPTVHEWRTIFTLRDYFNAYYTWNGSSNTDWNNSLNWTPTGVPGAASHVIIPDAGTTPNDPVLPSGNTTINTLSIEDGGILVMGSETITIQNSLSGGWEDQNPLGNDPGTSKVIFSTPNTTVSGHARFYDVEIGDGADITNQLASSMKIAHSITRSGTGKWYADVFDPTVEYNGSDQTVLLPDGSPQYHNLVLSGSGTKTMPASAMALHGDVTISGTASVTAADALTIGGNMILGSGTTFVAGVYSHHIGGDFQNNGATFTTAGSTFIFDGISAQTIDGTTASYFNNLTINNASGVQLGNSTTINGTLNLASGKITMGDYNLVLNTTHAIAGAPGSSNYIVYSGSGRLVKTATAAMNYAFPIGVAANYSPATFKLNSATIDGSSNLTINLTEGKQPDIGSAANYINRYWTITPSGTFTSLNYDVGFTYLQGDVIGNESIIKSSKYSGSWTQYSVTNTSSNLLSITGATSFSDYTGYGDLAVAPSASVNPVNAGSATTVSANAMGGKLPYTYVWSPDQGNVSSFNPSPALTNNTTYTVKVTDADSASITGSVTVTVNPLPAINLVVGGTTAICSGTGTNITVAGSVSGINYQLRDGVTNIGDAVAGTGGTINLPTGNLASTTTYNVLAIDALTEASAQLTETEVVTINALPNIFSITGTLSVCAGSTTQLSDATNGGVWASSDESKGTVSNVGLVSGVSVGTSTITYTVTNGSGCINSVTQLVTVNALPSVPSSITGTLSVCVGSTTQLSDATNGGVWASSDASKATVSNVGLVTGIASGTVTITYTVTNGNGCVTAVSQAVIVNALPVVSSITGTLSVCVGSTTQLSDVTNGGVWTSSDESKATVSNVGLVTGVASGTATITYTVTNGNGCVTAVNQLVTINALPTVSVITGTLSVCVGSATQLSDATNGGVWTSSDESKATVSNVGLVTGIGSGTATITYTVTNGNGCVTAVSQLITINALPTVSSITGTLSVCVGSTTQLSDATNGGVWSSSDASKATVSNVGLVSGVSAGTSTITYTITNGNSCVTAVNQLVTVNVLPVVSSITGTLSVCAGSTTQLSDATNGGVWTSFDESKATISNVGLVFGIASGTATIIYTVTNGNGCVTAVSQAVIVNALPVVSSITGTLSVCVGSTIQLSDATNGGVWASSDESKATVSNVGLVSGVSVGTATITYTVTNGNGCVTAVNQLATINALPTVSSITGTLSVCVGSTTQLSDATNGGVWTSSDESKATISNVGLVLGIASGTATITYTVTNGNGCVTAVNQLVTINALPTVSAITGTLSVCVGSATQLSDATNGGVWTSSDESKATVRNVGLVSGVSAGNSTITYTVTNGNGCITAISQAVTVNTLPTVSSITGTLSVCVGSTTQLSDATNGGVWASSDESKATISNVGLVLGIASGTSTITYTVTNGNGCVTEVNQLVTMNALPTLLSITGTLSVCVGSTTQLSDATNGGVWASSDANKATISNVGLVTGIAAGTATITYTVTNVNGCVTSVSQLVNINALPIVSSITGTSSVCVGLTTQLSDATNGGVWASSDESKATVSNVGLVRGVSAGTSTITYTITNGNGCINVSKQPVTINQLQTINIRPSDTTILKGNSVTLTARGIVNFSWSPSTGLSAINTAIVIANPVNSITYTVTGTDGNGCRGTATSVITVNDSLSAGAIGTDQTICSGSTPATLSSVTAASGGLGSISYQWQQSTNNINFGNISDAVSSTYSPAALSQSIYFRRSASTSNDTTVFTGAVLVNVITSVGGTINGSATVCSGVNTTVLTVTGQSGNVIKWESSAISDFSAGVTDINQITSSIRVSNLISTNYYRALVANGSCAGSNSAAAVISVNPLPDIIITPSSASIDAGTNIILTASGAITYEWTPLTSISSSTGTSVTVSPSATVTYTVLGTDANHCTASAGVLITVNQQTAPLIPGIIGADQTICSGSTATPFTSTAAASGGRGVIRYQWQLSTDSIQYTYISDSNAITCSPGVLTHTTFYRRLAFTSSNDSAYSNVIKITVLSLPVIQGTVSGDCTIAKDSLKTYAVTPALNATSYLWILPNGWIGNSTTSSVAVKAGVKNGILSIVPYNGVCAGTGKSISISVIDYAATLLTASPDKLPGDEISTSTISIRLKDVNGNPVACSGGQALLSATSGSITGITDNNDGTYTAKLSSSANHAVVHSSVGGVALADIAVNFSGPQLSVSGNGPLFSTEIPKLAISFTEGNGPFTVIYKAGNNTKNDTVNNVSDNIPFDVSYITTTTRYTIIAVIGSDHTIRRNHFANDSAVITVMAPRIVVTLKADLPKKIQDSVYATRLSIGVENAGDVDLSSVQVRANLFDVFPSPVAFVLDSVVFNGISIIPNKDFDGINNFNLFAWNILRNKQNVDLASLSMDQPASYPSVPKTVNALTGINTETVQLNNPVNTDNIENSEMFIRSEQDQQENPANHADQQSPYFFGTISQLPVGTKGNISLYVRIRPNGYTKPFVMQVAAVGTGVTQNGTALANSLSNDNRNPSLHPEVTKMGDPLPTVFAVIPNPVIGAALQTGLPVKQADSSYRVTLNYKLHNYGNVNLDSISLYQNLARSIGTPSVFTILHVYSNSGLLTVNPSYDGIRDTNLVSGTNMLGLDQEADIQMELRIVPNQLQLLYRMQASTSARFTDANILVVDLSTDGTNPDPDNNLVPDEHLLSYISINQPVPILVGGHITVVDPLYSDALITKGFCGPASAVYLFPSSNTTGGADPYEYQWQVSTDNEHYTNLPGVTDSVYTTDSIKTNSYLRRMVISGNQVSYSNPVYVQIYRVSVPVIRVIGAGTLDIYGSVILESSLASAYTWSTGAITQRLLVSTAGIYWVSIVNDKGCVARSGIQVVLPPLPSVTNATFIIGADNNLPSGLKMLAKTTAAGASLNFYADITCGIKLKSLDLPSTPGEYTYYVTQVVNELESSFKPLQVTMISPAKVVDLKKMVFKPAELQSDGSFLIGFTIRSINLRNELLDSVSIADDLSKVFPSSMKVEVASLVASGKLVANPFYDGFMRTDLLSPQSRLPGLQRDSIQLILKIFPNGFAGVLTNQATLKAVSPYGTFKVISNDPLVTGNYSFAIPTRFTVPVVDMIIPEGFSPNHDGKNDTYMIIRPYNTRIKLEVFNRWGNLVYRSEDYNNEWDGRSNQSGIMGNELPDGTYYYLISATNRSIAKFSQFKGFITLKR